MSKPIRSVIAKVVMSLALVLVPMMSIPAVAGAQSCSGTQNCTQGGVNCGAQLQVTTNGNCPTTDTSGNVTNIIRDVINIFSIIVGAVAVIMIIIGGFKYITSGGESSNVSGAKNTIIYAIVGLVIVVLAQVIVQFVLNKANTATGGM